MTAAYSFETVSAAIIVCSIIPILLIYPFLQKYFSKGMLLGGVKE
jgi:putative aldouronate transport system permease protein